MEYFVPAIIIFAVIVVFNTIRKNADPRQQQAADAIIQFAIQRKNNEISERNFLPALASVITSVPPHNRAHLASLVRARALANSSRLSSEDAMNLYKTTAELGLAANKVSSR